MTDILLGVVVVALVGVIVLQMLLLRRRVSIDLGPVERVDRSVREEIARNREEAASAARQGREETHAVLHATQQSLVTSVGELGKLQKGQLDGFAERLDRLASGLEVKQAELRTTVEQRMAAVQQETATKLETVRTESVAGAEKARNEVTLALKDFAGANEKRLDDFGGAMRMQLGNVVEQLGKLVESNQQKLETMRLTVEEKLRLLQEDNAKQLEQMRATVDEKLQGTLEKRLGESFKQVSERLEQVHKGLGEMQQLASGVGDLKRVLTNVKTRGTFGEVQLGAMLEQIFTPEQYGVNVATRDGGERVEFAIRLPGRGADADQTVWLPIDAKFPTEDHQRLVDAQERADLAAVEESGRALEMRIRQEAQRISTKYVEPPLTTDFAILYLPTEGLFAEVVRRPGLAELLQREHRVIVAGPTTLMALLSSLQMGFRTLAIEKRSSEVWATLGAVKTEWKKFGGVLDKVQKKILEASKTIDDAQQRTRVLGRKLKEVQELPVAETREVLMLDVGDGPADPDD